MNALAANLVIECEAISLFQFTVGLLSPKFFLIRWRKGVFLISNISGFMPNQASSYWPIIILDLLLISYVLNWIESSCIFYVLKIYHDLSVWQSVWIKDWQNIICEKRDVFPVLNNQFSPSKYIFHINNNFS